MVIIIKCCWRLSEHYKFDLETPMKDLPKKDPRCHFVWFKRCERFKFKYASEKIEFNRSSEFEGIANNMKRRYKETESNMVREELNKYISVKKCDVCDGERLE